MPVRPVLGAKGSIGAAIGFNQGAVAAVPWWYIAGKTCTAAFQPKGAASEEASKINLANPGVGNAVLNGSWTSAGWTGTGFTSSIQWQLTGNAFIMQFSGLTGNDVRMLNNLDFGFGVAIYPSFYGSVFYKYGTVSTSVSPALLSGNLALTFKKAYRNGNLDWSGGDDPQFVRSNSLSMIFGTGTLIACAMYSDDISSNVSGLATLMAAL